MASPEPQIQSRVNYGLIACFTIVSLTVGLAGGFVAGKGLFSTKNAEDDRDREIVKKYHDTNNKYRIKLLESLEKIMNMESQIKQIKREIQSEKNESVLKLQKDQLKAQEKMLNGYLNDAIDIWNAMKPDFIAYRDIAAKHPDWNISSMIPLFQELVKLNVDPTLR